MRKNPKAETQENVVLKTGTSRMILKWALICLVAGAIIGSCLMLVLNFGWLDKDRVAQDTSEIVASLASNEAESQNIESSSATKINLNALGINFYFEPVVYDGNEHKLVATYADGREVTNDDLAAVGLEVTYYNNVHVDAGRYEVNAIFTDANSEDGIEYEPLSKTAVMLINKATIKDAKFDSILVEYDGKEHSIWVEGNPEGTRVEYSMNKGTDEGVYYATAVIHGANYNPITLNATITIVNLQHLVKFDEDSYSFVYDNTKHYVILNTESVLEEIVNDRNFKIEYLNNGMVNAGEYTVVATVSAEGFTTFSLSVPVTVKKGDLVEVFGTYVEGVEIIYDGNTHEATAHNVPKGVSTTVKYFLDGEEVAEVKKPGTYKVEFTFVDTNGNLDDKVLECEIVIHKLNVSTLFTFDGNTFTFEVDKNNDNNPIERYLEVKFDKDHLSGMGINTDGLVITYTCGDKASGDPIKLTDVGEYVIKVEITGDETYTTLYENVELEATLKINYAELKGVSVASEQMVIANGKYQIPKYTAPSGTTVELFVKGKKVEGIKYFGKYDVTMVFTNGNYQTTRVVKMFVKVNTNFIKIAAVIGSIIGVILGIVLSIFGKKRDKASDVRFARPGEKLTSVRGKILCQSYASYGEKPRVEGRLYLTEKTVEFYGSDFSNRESRILIPLRDVRNVDATVVDTIKIRANDTDYVFHIPGCTSLEWKRQIVYAKAVPVVRMPDAVPVVMVDKIPQLQPQPVPASDTLTTVDFQVKVKTEPGANPEVTSEVVGTETTVTSAPEASEE